MATEAIEIKVYAYFYATGIFSQGMPNEVPNHLSLGDPGFGPQSPEEKILCYKYSQDVPEEMTWFLVTTQKDAVTCQDCLELIHA